MRSFLAVLLVTFSATSATAGLSAPSQTTGFAGINWTFGAGKSSPELIIGVAQKSGGCSSDVTGAKASVHFGLNGGFTFSKVKVTGLAGNSDVQGEFGFGFGSGAFAVAGLNGANFHLGADFGGAGYEGYVGVHSIGPMGGACVT